MKVEDLAKICHEANRAYCTTLGDNSQVPWEDAPDNIRQSERDGVWKILNGTITNPKQSHENWYRFKLGDGWQYGPVKDIEKKEHPCMVPFHMLPEEQQAKDYLFYNVVTALMYLIEDGPYRQQYQVEPEDKENARRAYQANFTNSFPPQPEGKE